MREHRLIERVVTLIDTEILRMQNERCIDLAIIDTIVDFLQTYADDTHHGKEEDILFLSLKNKKLSDDLRRITNELIEEHRQARATIKSIIDAKTKYVNGDISAIATIIADFKTLSALYPSHIEKEDLHYFFPVLEYFSESEIDTMMAEFNEFDRKMIHEKYTKIVDAAELVTRNVCNTDIQYLSDQKDSNRDIYVCKICGWTYDPAKGDPKGNVPPGIPFEKLPDDWRCPVCGVSKDKFRKL